MEELITIVIPSRTEDYILDICIKEIRKLYKFVNIILILDTISNKDYGNNVIKLQSDNKNMSAKRNLGVKYSKTKYIAFLDSDAYPVQGWLENAISFLENNSSYSAVTGKQYNPPTDNFVQICLRLIKYSRLCSHKAWCKIIDENVKECDCGEFSASNVIIKKEVYEILNGMDESFYLAEDNEFSVRLIENGYKIRFIPDIAVFHRESKFYSYFRKLWCMSYYYSEEFAKGKFVKKPDQIFVQFLPLVLSIAFILIFALFVYLKFNLLPLFILPLAVFLVIIIEVFRLTKQLKNNKIVGFLILLFSICLFYTVWIIASIAGLFTFRTGNVKELYKHY